MLDTHHLLFPGDFPLLLRRSASVLQVNLGYVCNQSCQHCHVAAGPARTEIMSEQTLEAVIALLRAGGYQQLDLTGGAPELNPGFERLVREARGLGIAVTDRCNLTILLEPDKLHLGSFLAQQGVHVVSSMPCYLQQNVDRQRGKGTHARSIEALRRLNALGYGQPDSGLVLDLVFNPLDAVLPGNQKELESAYKIHLLEHYGIVFNRLLTLTNMPINRFGSLLLSRGQFDSYMNLLKQNHCPDNLGQVMCLDLISIDWQGYVYDCDFNQMLGEPLRNREGKTLHVAELETADLEGLAIRVGDHCYGCTAGQGSSCGGALS